MTISDFENFIKENDCSDMVTVDYSALLMKPVELWFWSSLKQNSEKAVILDKRWLDLHKKKEKKQK